LVTWFGKTFIMDDYKAWFTVQCWGCNKIETRGYHNQEEADYQTNLLKLQGWRRRVFGGNINASPWFCGEDCATNSYNAKQAEEWWRQKEFEEYCNRRIIHPRYYGLLGITAFAIILMLAAFLSECVHAGTQ
jgi:hypothetical protein